MEGATSALLGHKLARPSKAVADGVYAEWSWDGSRLVVCNDRYGFHPLYYFARPGEVCLSPSIPDLVRHGGSPDLDETAFAAFLRLGYFLGEDTPFREIRALPPNARLEWADGELRLSGGYALGKPQSMKREEAIDAYVSLFRTAIERRAPPVEDFAVPLSGGRDSRHIVLELCAGGYRPALCVTVRQFIWHPGDIKVAATVTEALGLRHLIVPRTRSWLALQLREHPQTNFCSEELAWVVPIVDSLRGRVTLTYNGIGGDVLSEHHRLTPHRLSLFESGRLLELAEELIAWEDKVLRRVLLPDAYRRFSRDLALERIVPELARHVEAPNPVGSFYFWNRHRREIALSPFRLISQVGDVFCPYLDHDLYDFLSSLPASMLVDHRFHGDAVRRAHPRYAHIPFEDREGPAREDPRLFRRMAFDYARYAATQGRSEFVRTSYLASRLLRRVVDPDVRTMKVLAHRLIPYLLQLERFLRSAREGPDHIPAFSFFTNGRSATSSACSLRG